MGDEAEAKVSFHEPLSEVVLSWTETVSMETDSAAPEYYPSDHSGVCVCVCVGVGVCVCVCGYAYY